MDPTPSTEHNELMEEYYRRVSYSNENFDGWKDGWETDRGMIYILFGTSGSSRTYKPFHGKFNSLSSMVLLQNK